MTIWHWDEAHCIYRVTNTFYSVSCDAVSTIQIIVIELIFFNSRQFYYQLQNKAWKFGFFLKSSFSPIEKSTCKGKQYFHTSWPELFIFEDLVFMPRLIGLWILLWIFAETIWQIVFMSTVKCRSQMLSDRGRKTLHCAASGDDEPVIPLHKSLFASPTSELWLSRPGQGGCVLSVMWTIKC